MYSGVPIITPGPVRPLAGHGPGDAEVHDPRIAVLVDHDVLGLQVAMDDAQMMGLHQAFADLLGDRHGPARPELAGLPDEFLQILAGNELHGDEGRALGLAQVEHPADVPVADLAGELQLVREALDGLRSRAISGRSSLRAIFSLMSVSKTL